MVWVPPLHSVLGSGRCYSTGRGRLGLARIECRTRALNCVKSYRLPVDNGLMGSSEIATLLGVSRQRVHQLAQREDFPVPVARLAAGPIWESADIERWARESGRLE